MVSQTLEFQPDTEASRAMAVHDEPFLVVADTRIHAKPDGNLFVRSKHEFGGWAGLSGIAAYPRDSLSLTVV